MDESYERAGRHWCFTVNNLDKYCNGDRTNSSYCDRLWNAFRVASKKTTYGICQLEQADSTGKQHLQGYIEFPSTVRFERLRKILPGIHFERRKGTRDQARDYCRKLETRLGGPYEIGEYLPPVGRGNGKRERAVDVFDEIRASIKSGEASEEAIADKHFKIWTKSWRAFQRYEGMTAKPRDTAPEVYVLFGRPGSGKSTYARGLATHPDGVYHKPPGKWWDGYKPLVLDLLGHRVCILDDYNGYLTWTDFKLLCDAAPYRPEIKGGTLHFNSPIIVFTTNKDPMKWYKWEHDPYAHLALKRRIQHWMIFEKNADNEYVKYDYGAGEEGWKQFNEHLLQI